MFFLVISSLSFFFSIFLCLYLFCSSSFFFLSFCSLGVPHISVGYCLTSRSWLYFSYWKEQNDDISLSIHVEGELSCSGWTLTFLLPSETSFSLYFSLFLSLPLSSSPILSFAFSLLFSLTILLPINYSTLKTWAPLKTVICYSLSRLICLFFPSISSKRDNFM